MRRVAYTILCGMSQIMLQESAMVGALFLLGVFVSSWVAGVGALLGIVSGTITAYVLAYSPADIRRGLFGFNGALVGIALFTLLVPGMLTVMLTIIGSAASSIIMRSFLRLKLLPLTFPFVLVTWVLLFLVRMYWPWVHAPAGAAVGVHVGLLDALSMGFSQVMLQPHVVTGLLFLLALFLHSRTVAFFACFGVVMGTLTALVLALPWGAVIIGLYGFNGVLCGIAFAGAGKKQLLLALLASILSVLIMHGMMAAGMTALTFPFVLATWLVVGRKYLVSW